MVSHACPLSAQEAVPGGSRVQGYVVRPWLEKQIKQTQASVVVVMRGQRRRQKQQSGPSRPLAGLLLRAGAPRCVGVGVASV